MIKEHKSTFTKIEIAIDFLILVFSSFLTNYIVILLDGVTHLDGYSVIPNINTESYYYLVVFVFSALSIIFFFFDNAYLYYRFKPMKLLIKQIFSGVIKSSIIIVSLLLIFNNREFPLSYFFKYMIISTTVFLVYRIIFMKIFVMFITRGYGIKHIVVLYSDVVAENDFVKIFKNKKSWGLNILAEFNVMEDNDEGYNEFFTLLKTVAVDDIYLIPRNNSIMPNEKFHRFISLAYEFGKNIRFFFQGSSSLYTKLVPIVSYVDKYPSLLFSQKETLEANYAIKRLADIFFGIIGSFITILLIPILGIFIKTSSKGPLFFKQIRVGSNGRNFYIYKFRTMCNDAEEKKKDLQEHNELSGAVFKMKNDPRVTKIGKILRATSLDEFPQFFNVLIGDMSLIGTRPPTPNEVKEYENWQYKRISIKPGITGLWQVSGRNKIKDFDEIAKLDIEYIENWSLWLDLKIFLKTFKAIFSGQ